jgi:hypothetical protein
MKDESAFSLSYKVKYKEFRYCVECWCDFLNGAILVFLAIWQIDGFQCRPPLYEGMMPQTFILDL